MSNVTLIITKEVKIVADMCGQLYEFIQLECQKRPAELVPVVREFFAERACILLNEEFIRVDQLCWHLNVNLKSMFYQIPTAFLRSLKYLFNQVNECRVRILKFLKFIIVYFKFSCLWYIRIARFLVKEIKTKSKV